MSNVDEVVFTGVSAILWIRQKQIQISALSATFAVDQIPTATVILAGIEDDQIGLLQMGQKARIDVTLTDENGKQRLFTVFHGRTLAFSPSRELGRLSYVVTLTHWLSDLTLTSLHTHLLTGPAAGALVRPFTYRAGGVQGNVPASMLNTMANPFSDLWGAIKAQCLDAIGTASYVNKGVAAQVAQDQAAEREADGVCQNEYLRATEIMERYLDADVLGMNPQGEDEAMLKNSVKMAILTAVRTSAVGQTLWDALTSLGRMFFFNFIPLVEKVRVASIVPNLKSDCFLPYMELKPAEFHTFRINNLSGTHIRGVVLTSRYAPEAAATRAVPIDTPRLVGAFAPSQSGPLHTVEVPQWLYPLPTEELADALATGDALPGTGSDNTAGSPAIPAGLPARMTDQRKNPPQEGLGAAGENPAINPRDDIPIEAGDDEKFKVVMPSEMGISSAYVGTPAAAAAPPPASRLADRYAKACYAGIAMAGRTATVIGKLRFDIGPGTPIAITQPGAFKPGFGIVGAVTINIDVMQPVAETRFEIVAYRTYAEDKANAAMFDASPIFTSQPYKGDSPLAL